MTMTCPHCSYQRMPMEGDGPSCPRCGRRYDDPVEPKPVPEAALPTDPVELAWHRHDFRALNLEELALAAQRLELSTLTSGPEQGHRVLGIVSGSYTMAFGAVFEAVGGLVRNVVGTGSSALTQKLLDEGMLHASGQMKIRALQQFGADAVWGVRYQFEEISGANSKGILVILATGTAIMFK